MLKREPTKDIHIRLPIKMLETILAIAKQDKRSSSKQFELLLEKVLEK